MQHFNNMNVTIEKKIGNNIRNLRERLRYTQEYVATNMQLYGCDLTRSALAKIEVGQRHLYVDELIALKHILNVEFDDILN